MSAEPTTTDPTAAGSFADAFSLRGNVALVTGGASGIGHSIARVLAGHGARIVIADNHPSAAEVATRLGEGHIGVQIDVTRDGAPAEIVDLVVARAGRLDILVNNAGTARLAPAVDATREDWDFTMSLNVTASFLLAQAAGRHMIARAGGGRIINLASQAASVALQSHVAYCTSKAAILGMTKVMALEWGPHGITVNAISPTVVETELGKKVWAGEVGEAFKKLIPSRRFAQPDEIAYAALYLASPAAAMVNGADLAIDGGYTIQ